MIVERRQRPVCLIAIWPGPNSTPDSPKILVSRPTCGSRRTGDGGRILAHVVLLRKRRSREACKYLHLSTTRHCSVPAQPPLLVSLRRLAGRRGNHDQEIVARPSSTASTFLRFKILMVTGG